MTGKGFGLLFEMGCGKTLTAIMIAGTGYRLGKIRKVLVVAPTSVCSVWGNDLEAFADFRYTTAVMLGTKQQRLKALDDLVNFPFPAMKVAIINYESVWRDGIEERLAAWDPDLIIADESQRIKTHNAEQSEAMHRLGAKARYKLILSGTPVQNQAVDLFSQFKFLDASVFGENFYQFRNRYCVMGGFNNKQIIRYKDMEDLIRKQCSISFRVTKDEALDLPEQTFETRYIILDKKQREIYDRIRRDSFTELENGGQITASTVLTKLLRLQQFTGGFLVADDSSRPEQVSDAKVRALEDIVRDYVLETGKKLVIFARFRPEIAIIEEMLKKHRVRYGCIYGDVKPEERGGIVKDFQENTETKVMVCQTQTAGLGITLTAADTSVFYSLDYNLANYLQALARIHRIGQRMPVTYIHLICKGTIDETVLKALAKKEDLAKAVVDNWKMYFQ